MNERCEDMSPDEISLGVECVKWQINQINKQEQIHEGEAPLSMCIYLVSHVPAVSVTPAFKRKNKEKEKRFTQFLTHTHAYKI